MAISHDYRSPSGRAYDAFRPSIQSEAVDVIGTRIVGFQFQFKTRLSTRYLQALLPAPNLQAFSIIQRYIGISYGGK